MSVYTLIALVVAIAALLAVMTSFSQRRRMRPEYVRARQVAQRVAQAREVGSLASTQGER